MDYDDSNENLGFDGFVKPDHTTPGKNRNGKWSGQFFYEEGVLYRSEDRVEPVAVNACLPVAEWYEVVEIAQSPTDPNELWLAIGGRELHCTTDGGKTFRKIPEIVSVADLSFVPWLRGEQDYVLYMVGALSSGQRGAFVAQNHGKSWMSYDFCEVLPLL